MAKQNLIIATRGSQLALWQANWVAESLKKSHPTLQIDLLPINTTADKSPYLSLAASGGKGLFVKELEQALQDGRADIAVHSLKDMPMDVPDGLALPVICQREQPWDVLVSNQYKCLADLPQGAVVGTSSLRRQSQLHHLRPDLRVEGLRGNVNTRLARLDSGEYAAIVLAAAGLIRLGLLPRVTAMLGSNEFLPAAGQGALGIECRADDSEILQLITSLNDKTTELCTKAERALCKKLEAGCQVPVAAYAEMKDDHIFLRGLVSSIDGKTMLRAQAYGSATEPEKMGAIVALDLLNQGAEKILKSLR